MDKRVFLIDDEADFTDLTKSLFEFQGFQAETCNNPFEALKKLDKETFDVLIVDIMMPGMDGISLVNKLRSTERYASTPIFILSAKDLEDKDRKILLGKKIHYVSKPFEPRRLVDLVRESFA